MKVRCSCGKEFRNIQEQKEHSIILAPFGKILSPEHRIDIKKLNSKKGDKNGSY